MRQLKAVGTQQKRNQLKAGQIWSNPDALCFTDQFGRYVAPPSLYKQFKRIAAEIGYPDLRFHDLRHTYAVNALRSGDDIKTVQGNLGHHTAAFTLDTYAHVTEEMRKDSAERMEAFIQRQKSS